MRHICYFVLLLFWITGACYVAQADGILPVLMAGKLLPPQYRQCKEDSDCQAVSARCMHLGKWGWYAASTASLPALKAELDNQEAISCTPPETLLVKPRAGCNGGLCALLPDQDNCLLRRVSDDECAVPCTTKDENGTCELR